MQRFVSCVLLVVILTACSSPAETVPTSSPLPAPSSPTGTASPMPADTATAIPAPTKVGMYVPTQAYARFGGGILTEVAISPDGQNYAIASSVGAAVYDFETHIVQHVISSGQWVQSITYSPDGAMLATGTSWGENNVQIWDVGTGKSIGKFTAENNVGRVHFSPDGNWIAAGTWDGKVFIWDVQSRHLIKTLTDYRGFIYSIDFSPDGNRIMATGRDSSMMVWDVKSGDLLVNIRTGTFEGNGAFLLDGVQIAAVTGTSVKIWNVETGLRVAEYKHPQKPIPTVLAVSPDGESLYVGYKDGRVLELDADPFLMAHEYEGNGESVASIAISPSQEHLLVATASHSIVVWDMESREKISENTNPGHSGYVSSLTVSPDGKQLISGADDGRLYAWNLGTNAATLIDQGGHHRVEDVRFFPDGERFISVTCNEGFFVTNAIDHSLIKAGSWGDGKACYANSAVAVSYNANILAIGTDAGGVEIRDNQYTRKSRFFVTGGVADLEFSPDDVYLAVAYNRRNGENFVSIIEVQSGAVISQITSYTDRVTDVEFSPDGKYLASSSGSWFSDGEIIVWDLEKQRTVKTLPEGAHAIRFSPDGRYLARGGLWDFTITLLDTDSWQAKHALSGHSMLVYALEFSPDGSLLFSGSYDGTVLAWLIE